MNATLGMRHAVLWVSDPKASAEFYQQALGLEPKVETDQAVFMSSPNSGTDHDLGLFKATERSPGGRATGLYHIAWEVETLTDLADAKVRLAKMGALVGENNHGVSRSLYCQDPDGIEFEIMWELPFEFLTGDEPSSAPLDIEADMAKFGANTPGRSGPAS